jgi:DNA-binding MarR family transcriptional regulator
MPLEFLSPLHKASRQLTVHLEGQTRTLGVSAAEGHLLTYLRSYGPVPVGELVRVFGLKRSTMTSMLDRLEADGLLRREANPEDGRSFLVQLSPAGAELTQQLHRCLQELEKAIRRRVGPGEIAGFRAVMEAIGEITGVRLRDEAE